MKYILFALLFSILLCTGCEEECKEKIHTGTLVIDITDSTIVKQFRKELTAATGKLSPNKLNRCEGVEVEVIPIGATIDNQTVKLHFPATGTIDKSIGQYALEDSNAAKYPYLVRCIEDALNGFYAVKDSKSQIFYTINSIIHHNSGHCIIYTDLLENYDDIKFKRKDYDFEMTFNKLIKLYKIDTTEKVVFNGKLTIISSMAKNQDEVVNARAFYKYYFNRIGLPPSQYEFTGTISQSKL